VGTGATTRAGFGLRVAGPAGGTPGVLPGLLLAAAVVATAAALAYTRGRARAPGPVAELVATRDARGMVVDVTMREGSGDADLVRVAAWLERVNAGQPHRMLARFHVPGRPSRAIDFPLSGDDAAPPR
jgi:hypothetical protein